MLETKIKEAKGQENGRFGWWKTRWVKNPCGVECVLMVFSSLWLVLIGLVVLFGLGG